MYSRMREEEGPGPGPLVLVSPGVSSGPVAPGPSSGPEPQAASQVGMQEPPSEAKQRFEALLARIRAKQRAKERQPDTPAG